MNKSRKTESVKPRDLELKPPDTFEKRFESLNRRLGPKENISFTFIPKIICPDRTNSAPADLVHDSIVFEHKNIHAFEPNRPTPEPNIYLKSILSKCDLWKLIHATDDSRVKMIFDEILTKEFPNNEQRQVLRDLLTSIFVFCKHENFSNLRTDTLIKLFYYTHKYLISSLSRAADEIYLYFKKLMILHSVLNPPTSTRIFSPYESQRCLLTFCKLYMRHLPLIRAICVPLYVLEINPQNYPVHPLLVEK